MYKKNLFWLLWAVFLFPLFLVSCDESTEESEYANWRERNQLVIDSIAQVAKANADGKWHIYKSYSLPADDPNDLTAVYNVNNYVYCHVESEGTGTVSPIYTDSIRANYRVWYINGEVLDQSFRGDFNPDFAVPAEFAMSGLINGWITALQRMHTGDIWTVYIPYPLGYGTAASGSVPGYSTLKFWINLVGVYPTGTVIPDWQ